MYYVYVIVSKTLINKTMKKGDKYEYNTNNREQYILEVERFNNENVWFKAKYKHPEDGSSFNIEVKQEVLSRMIKANNIRLMEVEELAV